MLHTKIVDSKNKKLSINDAERFIYFLKNLEHQYFLLAQ